MKLSVSNIALKKNLDYVLNFFERENCSGIEIAPDLVWENPTKTSFFERKSVLKKIKGKNLEITGFHSLLFQKDECQMFGDKEFRKIFLDYLKNIMQLCADVEGKQVVYGSPKSRELQKKSLDEARKISLDIFDELSQFGKDLNVYFCIEPLDKIECEFINNYREAIELVKKINNDFFKINFDTKTLFYSQENLDELKKNFDYFVHFQISEKGLKPICYSDQDHNKINRFLRENCYNKFLSIEMIDTGNEEDLKKSISYVKKHYELK